MPNIAQADCLVTMMCLGLPDIECKKIGMEKLSR